MLLNISCRYRNVHIFNNLNEYVFFLNWNIQHLNVITLAGIIKNSNEGRRNGFQKEFSRIIGIYYMIIKTKL